MLKVKTNRLEEDRWMASGAHILLHYIGKYCGIVPSPRKDNL